MLRNTLLLLDCTLALFGHIPRNTQQQTNVHQDEQSSQRYIIPQRSTFSPFRDYSESSSHSSRQYIRPQPDTDTHDRSGNRMRQRQINDRQRSIQRQWADYFKSLRLYRQRQQQLHRPAGKHLTGKAKRSKKHRGKGKTITRPVDGDDVVAPGILSEPEVDEPVQTNPIPNSDETLNNEPNPEIIPESPPLPEPDIETHESNNPETQTNPDPIYPPQEHEIVPTNLKYPLDASPLSEIGEEVGNNQPTTTSSIPATPAPISKVSHTN